MALITPHTSSHPQESGSAAEPLFLDVLSALAEADADAAHGAPAKHRVVVGGIYGLGSKEFTPAMAVSVYDNLALSNPKRRFTVRGVCCLWRRGCSAHPSKRLTSSLCVASLHTDLLAPPASLNTPTHPQVGIIDDVRNSHLPLGPKLNTMPAGTRQCMFWGMGSDGTVGANKEAIKIIADNTPLFTQVGVACT